MTTAEEVRMIGRHRARDLYKLQEVFREHFTAPVTRAYCALVVLGCVKQHNRSPKSMARLRHSLTRIFIGQI